MMKQGLYHKDLENFPTLNVADKNVKPRYTIHAFDSAENDRYGVILLPATINLSKAVIFEIEIGKNDTIEKVCIRMSYNKDYDLCMAIIPDGLVVKTVWLNSVEDSHRTLDTGKYVNG